MHLICLIVVRHFGTRVYRIVVSLHFSLQTNQSTVSEPTSNLDAANVESLAAALVLKHTYTPLRCVVRRVRFVLDCLAIMFVIVDRGVCLVM
jgi:hypothetical protein